MLGEKLGEETGKITGYRVRPSDGMHPRVEVSFQAAGQLLGIDTTDMGTYQSVLGADGVLRGEGQGVIMTGEGDVITWTGQGVGRFTGQGSGSSWRGAIYYKRHLRSWLVSMLLLRSSNMRWMEKGMCTI